MTSLNFTNLNDLPEFIQKEIKDKFGVDCFNYHHLYRTCLEVVQWMRENHPNELLIFESVDGDEIS